MKRTFVLALLTLHSFFEVSSVAAYDSNFVHRNINERAAEQSLLDQYMQQFLGYQFGLLTEFNGISTRQWISDGGHSEDNFPRPQYHFHDPLEPFNDAGFSLRVFGIPFRTYSSSLVWAQYEDINPKTGNYASWHSARQLFFKALTTGSEQIYAGMFQALGQLTHLVSDKAVPAHVRDDNHIYESLARNFFEMQHIEHWAATNQRILPYDNGVGPDAKIFANYTHTDLAPIPVAILWDSDQYTGANALDSDSTSFILKNKKGEQVRGFTGDFIGSQQLEVTEVTDKYITLETIEIVTDENGNVHEQPSRMQIPISFATYGHGIIIQ